MRTDQAFVLLLILLLPLTGCIDTIGEVDAEDSTESSDAPETHGHEVIFLDNGSSVAVTVNDTIVQIVDHSRAGQYEYVTGAVAQINVDCGSVFSQDVRVEHEDFVPTVPGMDCVVTFKTWDDSPAMFVLLQHPATRIL